MSEQKSPQDVTFEEALERYEKRRPGEVTEGTIKSYVSGIKWFGDWLDSEGYTLQNLRPIDVDGFWPYLRDESGLTELTLQQYTQAIRLFLEFLEGLGVVNNGLHKNIPHYYVEKSLKAWDVDLPSDRIGRLVRHFRDHYGPRKDVLVFRLLAKTGLRSSGLVAIDVEDIDYNSEVGPRIYLKNRDETELKGRDKHERVISIGEPLFEDLMQYIEHRREPYESDSGRKPLFTTRYGRMSKDTVKDIVYQLSSPAFTDIGTCDCETRPNRSEAVTCNKSFSPHYLRKYHVTELRGKGISFENISERVGADKEVLKDHYDKSTEEEKQQRRYEVMKGAL